MNVVDNSIDKILNLINLAGNQSVTAGTESTHKLNQKPLQNHNAMDVNPPLGTIEESNNQESELDVKKIKSLAQGMRKSQVFQSQFGQGPTMASQDVRRSMGAASNSIQQAKSIK